MEEAIVEQSPRKVTSPLSEKGEDDLAKNPPSSPHPGSRSNARRRRSRTAGGDPDVTDSIRRKRSTSRSVTNRGNSRNPPLQRTRSRSLDPADVHSQRSVSPKRKPSNSGDRAQQQQSPRRVTSNSPHKRRVTRKPSGDAVETVSWVRGSSARSISPSSGSVSPSARRPRNRTSAASPKPVRAVRDVDGSSRTHGSRAQKERRSTRRSKVDGNLDASRSSVMDASRTTTSRSKKEGPPPTRRTRAEKRPTITSGRPSGNDPQSLDASESLDAATDVLAQSRNSFTGPLDASTTSGLMMDQSIRRRERLPVNNRRTRAGGENRRRPSGTSLDLNASQTMDTGGDLEPPSGRRREGPPANNRRNRDNRRIRRSSGSFGEEDLPSMLEAPQQQQQSNQQRRHRGAADNPRLGQSLSSFEASVDAKPSRRSNVARNSRSIAAQRQQEQLAASCSVLVFEPETDEAPAAVTAEETCNGELEGTQKKKKMGMLSTLKKQTTKALKKTLKETMRVTKKTMMKKKDDDPEVTEDGSAGMQTDNNRSGDEGAGMEVQWQRTPSNRLPPAQESAATRASGESDYADEEERDRRRRPRRDTTRDAGKQAARERNDRCAESTDDEQEPRRRRPRSGAPGSAAAARARARRESGQPARKRTDSQSAAAEAAARARIRARKKGANLAGDNPLPPVNDEEQQRELQHKKFMEAAIKSAEAKTRKKELAKKLGLDAARAASTRNLGAAMSYRDGESDKKRIMVRNLSKAAAKAASTRKLVMEQEHQEEDLDRRIQLRQLSNDAAMAASTRKLGF